MFRVSTSIAEDSLLWPYFLPPCLTGAAYHNFVQNVLPELLYDVALQSRIHLRIIHADAPQHFLLTVQEFSNNVLPVWWIGQSGPTAWPAGSADWNPYIFISGDFQSALFNLRKPVTSTTCHNEYRMHLRRNFPPTLTITVQTNNTLHRSSSLTHWAFPLVSRRP